MRLRKRLAHSFLGVWLQVPVDPIGILPGSKDPWLHPLVLGKTAVRRLFRSRPEAVPGEGTTV